MFPFSRLKAATLHPGVWPHSFHMKTLRFLLPTINTLGALSVLGIDLCLEHFHTSKNKFKNVIGGISKGRASISLFVEKKNKRNKRAHCLSWHTIGEQALLGKDNQENEFQVGNLLSWGGGGHTCSQGSGAWQRDCDHRSGSSGWWRLALWYAGERNQDPLGGWSCATDHTGGELGSLLLSPPVCDANHSPPGTRNGTDSKRSIL